MFLSFNFYLGSFPQADLDLADQVTAQNHASLRFQHVECLEQGHQTKEGLHFGCVNTLED